MQLLVDFNNLLMRNFFAARRDIEDIGYGYLKHIIINSLFYLCKKFDPEEVVIAVDSGKYNWRKKVYPLYKQNRKDRREEQDDIDWESLFAEADQLLKELKVYFPFYVLKVQYMEADDIIGVFAKEHQHTKKVIVSSDKDFIQLLKYKNIQLFNPIESNYIQCDDPKRSLKIKILSGDGGDNIPNIFKDFVGDKTVTKRMGEKTAEQYVDGKKDFKILLESDEEVSKSDNDGKELFNERIKRNLKRNKTLIDLSLTPKKLCDTLLELYEDYEISNGKDIFKYFHKNSMREFINRIDEIEVYIKKLNEYNRNKTIFN